MGPSLDPISSETVLDLHKTDDLAPCLQPHAKKQKAWLSLLLILALLLDLVFVKETKTRQSQRAEPTPCCRHQ